MAVVRPWRNHTASTGLGPRVKAALAPRPEKRSQKRPRSQCTGGMLLVLWCYRRVLNCVFQRRLRAPNNRGGKLVSGWPRVPPKDGDRESKGGGEEGEEGRGWRGEGGEREDEGEG